MKALSDQELLREYAGNGDEAAFREIVLRHTDLLYSAALRQAGSPDLARDLLQNVFVDLARKSRSVTDTSSLAPGAEISVLGWLYRGLHYEAANHRREARRRKNRETLAMEPSELHSSSEPSIDWEQVRPVLDEAMADLKDPDREALLLRFFKNQDFADVGRALGVSDDAAQKRVSRALERLRQSFSSRGLTTTALALSAVLSAHSVHAAPVGLAASLAASASTVAGATMAAGAGLSTGLSQTITMTTLQKMILGATLVVAVGTGVYETRQAVRWRQTAASLTAAQARLEEQLDQSERSRETVARELSALRGTQSRPQTQAPSAELLRLRGEVSRLRALEQQFAQLKQPAAATADPFTQSVLDLTSRAAELNGHLEASPQLRIPELNLLTESDWLEAAKKAKFGTAEEVKVSLMQLRGRAKHNAYGLWQEALKGYLDANGGQLPVETLQLKPYFKDGVDDAMLQRYRMTQAGGHPAEAGSPVWLIEEIAPVDPEYDTRMRMGLGSLDIAVITPGP
jgi:RNA polymerase sigma factor (sigma-70 family)